MICPKCHSNLLRETTVVTKHIGPQHDRWPIEWVDLYACSQISCSGKSWEYRSRK